MLLLPQVSTCLNKKENAIQQEFFDARKRKILGGNI
jgi:hypothetical protein